MITLKQVEALHWIVVMGSFERAAAKLNTTQSAISKRIRELELATGHSVFDRQLRTARLTEKGEYLLALGREMLATQQRMLDAKDGETPHRSLRLGVTELSAITWLPRLVTAIRQTYPMVTLEPEVEHSRTLHERLVEGSLDLIVIPAAFSDPSVAMVHLGEVKNVWMVKPGHVAPRRSVPITELSKLPLLVQGRRSGSGVFYHKWLRAEGVVFERTLSTDSLMALVGMTVAGLGVTYLPWPCFKPLVDEGKLTVVRTKPLLPAVPYVAAYNIDRPHTFMAAIANLAREYCNFAHQLQS